MKKIKDIPIKKEHLMIQLIQSLLYWLSDDLDSFIINNTQNEEFLIKNIGGICMKKDSIRRLIDILSNTDPEIKCDFERKKVEMYSDFVIKTARTILNKPIIDIRPSEIIETLAAEDEEYEAEFIKAYSNYLDENDPGKILMNLFDKALDILGILSGTEIDDDLYNKEIYLKFNQEIKALKAEAENVMKYEDYSNFLIDEIIRIDCKDKESVKSWVAERSILIWRNIFNDFIIYCNNIIKAAEEEDHLAILETAIEIQHLHYLIMYQSIQMIRGYFYLTDYKWVPVNILNAPKEQEWMKVV